MPETQPLTLISEVKFLKSTKKRLKAQYPNFPQILFQSLDAREKVLGVLSGISTPLISLEDSLDP
jgi:hypothetical protein